MNAGNESWTALNQVLQQKHTQIQEQDFKNHAYYSLRIKWRHHYYNRIDKILLAAKSVSLPIDFKPFENYFSGFTVEYRAFDNEKMPTLHGFSDYNNGHIRIFYASNCVEHRQRFTIAHEFIHIYQLFDPEFRAELEALPSEAAQQDMAEHIANKAAAFYLVPKPILEQELERPKNMIGVCSFFGVSQATLDICLKDYDLAHLKNNLNAPPW